MLVYPEFRVCSSSSKRFLTLHITTQDVRSFLFGDGISTSIPGWPSSRAMRTSTTGPITVPTRITAKTLDFGFDWRWVYSRNTGVNPPKPSSTSWLVLFFYSKFYRVPEWCELRNLCNLIDFRSQFEVLQIFLQSVSRRIHTLKSFQYCFVMEYSFFVDFSEIDSLSYWLRSNCWLQFETAR